MVWNQHRFMVGIDYTDDHFALPLYWLVIAALLIAGAALIVAAPLDRRRRRGRRQPRAAVRSCPRIAGSLYVKPNEISLERPYIQTHIEATRAAYGLSTRVQRDRDAHQSDGDHRRRRRTRRCSITCGSGTGGLSTTP